MSTAELTKLVADTPREGLPDLLASLARATAEAQIRLFAPPPAAKSSAA